MTDFNQPNSDNRPFIPIDALARIAQQHLDIDTLEERGRDALDFYDCSIWSIKAILKDAYLLGHGSARRDVPVHSDDAVLARDLRIDYWNSLRKPRPRMPSVSWRIPAGVPKIQ